MVKKIAWLLLFIISLFSFIYISVIIINKGGDPTNIDVAIRDFCYEHRGNKGEFLYWLFLSFSEFGYYRIIGAIIIIMIIFTKCDNKTISLILGLLIALSLSIAFKNVFSRGRPYVAYRWGLNTATAAYPSSYVTLSTFTWTFISYFTIKSNIRNWKKIIVVVLSIFIILSVISSRLFLGMNYFTDTIAGFALGFMVFLFIIIIYNFMVKRKVLEGGIKFKKE